MSSSISSLSSLPPPPPPPLPTLEVDFDTNPTKLYLSITSSDWTAASQALTMNPSESRTWVSRRNEPPSGPYVWRFLPLHSACARQPPASIIEDLLRNYPEASMERDDQGMLPVHYACGNHASEEVIYMLLVAYPESIAMKEPVGEKLPIHFVCEWGASSLSVVNMLLAVFPESIVVGDAEGNTPLDLEEDPEVLSVMKRCGISARTKGYSATFRVLNDDSEQKALALEEEVNKLNDEKSALNIRLKDEIDRRKAQARDLTKSKNDNQRSQRENHSLTEKLKKEHMIELEKMERDHKKQMDDMQKQKDDMQMQMDDMQKRMDEWRETQNKIRKRHGIPDKLDLWSAINDKISSSETSEDSLKAKLSDKDSEILHMEEENNSLRKLMSMLSDEKSDLEAEKENFISQIATLSDRKSVFKNKCDRLENENEALRTTVDDLTHVKLHSLEKTHARLEESHETLLARCDSLEREILRYETETARLYDTQTRYETQLEELTQRNEKYEEDVKEAKEDVRSLKRTLVMISEENKCVEDEKLALMAKKEEVEKEVEMWSDKASGLMTENERLRERMDGMEDEARERFREMRVVMEALKRSIGVALGSDNSDDMVGQIMVKQQQQQQQQEYYDDYDGPCPETLQ